jgi:hypothetical protein
MVRTIRRWGVAICTLEIDEVIIIEAVDRPTPNGRRVMPVGWQSNPRKG